MCKELWISKRHLLPIGAGICKHCQKRHKQDLPATCRIDFAKELGKYIFFEKSFEHIGLADSMDKVSRDTRGGDLSSFQCIAAADKNTLYGFRIMLHSKFILWIISTSFLS
uniref:Uncharacterized protein LOC111119977 isoform X1 n=1 Tax=Crassostrea virginica TaxID=6565 RepID=A0A8B8CPE9_CRAVI|nr:uncharacterized protein LOC111119977 isoform X1 [Crassostrea virginica]